MQLSGRVAPYTSEVRISRSPNSLKFSQRPVIAIGASSLAPILPRSADCGAHRTRPTACLEYPSSSTVPAWISKSRTYPYGSHLPTLKLPPNPRPLCLGTRGRACSPRALSTAWAGRTCLPTPSGSASLVPSSLRGTFCTTHPVVDHLLSAHVLHLSLGCTHHRGDTAHWDPRRIMEARGARIQSWTIERIL